MQASPKGEHDEKVAFATLAALIVLVGTGACDDETASPEAGPNEDDWAMVRFYTEDIPVDGMVLFRDGARIPAPNAREFRFAEFVTDIPADEDRLAIFTHDIDLARSFELTGGFPWGDGMLYRAAGHAPPLASLAIAGLLPAGFPAFQDDDEDPTCYLADDTNRPGWFSFLRQSDRSHEFRDFAECMGDLAETIEGEEQCIVAVQPVWNPETEVYDLHATVVCEEEID